MLASSMPDWSFFFEKQVQVVIEIHEDFHSKASESFLSHTKHTLSVEYEP
jgi:hypothetical protein